MIYAADSFLEKVIHDFEDEAVFEEELDWAALLAEIWMPIRKEDVYA